MEAAMSGNLILFTETLPDPRYAAGGPEEMIM